MLGVGPYRGHREEIRAAWRKDIAELAKCPNVNVKLGGVGMTSFGFDFHERDVPPSSEELAAAWRQYIEPCIEAFGPDRCMFESNFPPDKQSGGYTRAVECVQAHHRRRVGGGEGGAVQRHRRARVPADQTLSQARSRSDVAASIALSGRMPWMLLAAAALTMFTVTASGTTRAPFLIDMARDLSVSVAHVADLVAVSSVSWAATSMLAGAGSDRWGRRPFLIGGPLALAFATIGIANAGSFLTVAAWVTVAGGCCGLFSGVIFAEVSARVSTTQQGRALGWVMTGQSLTLLIGVPLAAFAGEWIGWRGVHVCMAGFALATAISMFVASASRDELPSAGTRMPSMRTALSRPVMRLLCMGITERICYALVGVYYATFLQATYGLTPAAGRAAAGDLRARQHRRHRAWRPACRQAARSAGDLRRRHAGIWRCGAGAVRLANDVETSVGLGFAYVFFNAIARPSLMASLSDVPEHVRGTVMGLNVACNSIGWLSAASLGGWMIGLYGFAGFGPLAAAVATAGGVLALARRR